MTLIRALTFDLDNTLWETDSAMLRAEDVMASHLRKIAPRNWMVGFCPDTFRAARCQVINDHPDIEHNFTVVRRETLIRWFESQGAQRKIATELAEEGFRAFYEERQNVDLYPDTVETLAHLSKSFPLGAITNGNADLMAMPVGQYFQFSLQSQHFPRAKPDPVMFEEALDRLGVAAPECLHIGDDIDDDVEGAKAIGIRTVWFNKKNQKPSTPVQSDYMITDLNELVELLKPLD